MITINLTGCMDYEMDFAGWGGLGGGYYGGGYYYEPTYSASFYVDSVVQVDSSKIKIWAQIRYDSVLTIENRSVSYWNSNGENVVRIIQSQPSVINFKELADSTLAWTGNYEKIYKYTVEVDSLVKHFDYAMYLSNTYTEKSILKSTQNWFNIHLK
jgi:hypothetical protein